MTINHGRDVWPGQVVAAAGDVRPEGEMPVTRIGITGHVYLENQLPRGFIRAAIRDVARTVRRVT